MADEPTKFCKDCAHLVGMRRNEEDALGWKCHAEANIASRHRDPVTGQNVYKLLYEYCYDARKDHMFMFPEGEKVVTCGSAGQWYTKYEFVPQNRQGEIFAGKRTPNPVRPPQADYLLDELENLTNEQSSAGTGTTTAASTRLDEADGNSPRQEPPLGS